ncbi:MAG: hypothetical protein R3C44_03265 [Chloroflexota bacterium]
MLWIGRGRKAYSFGYYGQIFLNLKGREPQGVVDPADYDALRDEIAAAMLTIVDPEDGLPVVDRVYRKEELYHGRYLETAPDLLAIMRDLTYITRMGYEFAGQRGELFRVPYTDETGSHRLEGIVIGAGPDIQQGQVLPEHIIYDLTPTLLHLQGSPVPDYMDGVIMSDMLDADWLDANPLQTVESVISERDAAIGSWDAAAEEDVTERLKQLGYLG